MSAVESRIESKEMAKTSESMDSFETVDEDKDSDEESFHLFLEGDEDHNKSDDKISLDLDEGTNKEVNEETEIEASLLQEEENDSVEDKQKIGDSESTDVNQEIPCETDQLAKTNENTECKQIDESEKDLLSENSSKIINSQEKVSEKECSSLSTASDVNLDADPSSENEDDILNKHDNECSGELGNSVEELDPTIEDSLLNECEDFENDESNKNCLEKLDTETLTETKQIEAPEIAINQVEASESTTKQIEVTESATEQIEVTESATEQVEVTESATKQVEVTESATKQVEVTESATKQVEVTESATKQVTDNTTKQVVTESATNQVDVTESETNQVDVAESATKQVEVTESAVNKESNNSEEIMPANGQDSGVTVEENTGKTLPSVPNSDKCDENSSSSNPESEDLLDISMIKDSAQDDADIEEDARQLEQENDDSNSKVIENVDDTSNSGNSEDYGKTESETFEIVQNAESSDSEKEIQESDQEETANKVGEPQNEEQGEKVEENNAVIAENGEVKTEKPAKRSLPCSDIEPSSKRIKLVDTLLENVDVDSWDITELQSLISFSKFMTKSHLKKLTRSDLEEFCTQKLCEAILHKSELGETNHQLKIQEQTIETLRRDQAVLTKQIKDLEIVNKKLMNEILASNGIKPVLPVKITRSVGLQVRLPSANDPNVAKRRSLPNPNKPNGPQNQITTPKGRTLTNNNTPNRTIVQPTQPKQTTPILTKALQNRNRTPVKTPQTNSATQRSPGKTFAPPEKRARTSGSFIDLTDEDDKKTNNKNVKSIVPQGVRINSVPKTVSSVMPTTPQLMYVVQPNSQLKQGVLTTQGGQKAVLVNFQPTNGVINTLNNSSVSVIPKVTGNIALKPKPPVQTSLLKSNKHPAPLPSPPAIQGPSDKILKAIPPKPVLSIRKTSTGIILQWRMPYDLGNYEAIASYQLYAYQETSAVPSTDMWRKVGDVKAMALPMACTLTQFADKNKYYFAVRPVDIHKRIGRFSHPVLSE